jgi:hypothetical protein
MLPLAAASLPSTPTELASALTAGFAAHSITLREVKTEGAALDALQLFRIDLTGAQLTRHLRVTAPPASGPATIQAERLEIAGSPVEFEKLPLTVEVQADRAGLRVAGLPGDGVLAFASAESGHISVAAGITDLEGLLHRLASGPAQKQGVDIKRVKLELTARSPREVSFCCTITAKLFVMSADLSLNGLLAIDSVLNARLTSLTLGGDAMVTKLAGGVIRPQLDRLEGRVFPLAAFAPSGLPLRDVEITPTADRLTIQAKFGRGADS